MHSPHAAFFEFREATKDLGELSETQQIMTLKFELFHALERAQDHQNRTRSLQAELDELRAEASMRNREQQAFSAELHRQLTERSRELASVKADGQEQLHALRLEVLCMDRQCQALDQICRSLLVTIEQAACPDLATSAETEPAAEARKCA
jgi:hypothetical protein